MAKVWKTKTELGHMRIGTHEGDPDQELLAYALKAFDTRLNPDEYKRDQMVGFIMALIEGAKYRERELAQTDRVQIAIAEDAPRVRIMIHEQEGKFGKDSVKAGLNGVVFNIPREMEVELPEDVFNACIKNAIMTVYEPREVSPGVMETEERDVRRFPYTYLGRVEKPVQQGVTDDASVGTG